MTCVRFTDFASCLLENPFRSYNTMEILSGAASNSDNFEFLSRLSSRGHFVVTSATIACATEEFPPVIPSITLAKSITTIGIIIPKISFDSGIKNASPKTHQLKKVPIWVKIKIGFRPYLHRITFIRGVVIVHTYILRINVIA